MTVEEARKKECRTLPMYLQSAGDLGIAGTGTLEFIPSSCSADRCMHWRWQSSARINGYCGLSGKEGSE